MCSYGLGTELCLVIFAVFFFLDVFAGSVVVVVAGAIAAGVVVVTAGDGAGAAAGAWVVAVLGAALVFGEFSASTGAAGKETNITAAAAPAIESSFFIRNSDVVRL